MNRTILIVICDFLLVSCCVLHGGHQQDDEDRGTPPQVRVDMATNQADSGRDLAAVMKLAWRTNKSAGDLLLSELEKSRASVSEREKTIAGLRATAANHRTTANQPATTVCRGPDQHRNLSRQVRASSTDATMSKEKLAAMEAELRKRAEEAARFNNGSRTSRRATRWF